MTLKKVLIAAFEYLGERYGEVRAGLFTEVHGRR